MTSKLRADARLARTSGLTSCRHLSDVGGHLRNRLPNVCFAPSAEIAEGEARGRVDWLRNERIADSHAAADAFV